MDRFKVVVASDNPVKLRAVFQGFLRMFPDREFEVVSLQGSSGVRAQPLSDIETLQGAENRSNIARSAVPSADFWVGVEGGIQNLGEELAAFAWVVVSSDQKTGRARTGTFSLPPAVAQLIKMGKELGDADDIVFGRSNSKQENGAIGILTENVVDRAALYEQAVILALVSFKNPELYR